MALQLDQWFIHAVNDNAQHLYQQTDQRSRGATRVQEGVVGKTYPFNLIGKSRMFPITTRDGDTQYINPTQTKRRANLGDYGAAILIDKLDTIKTLTNPQSEFMISLMAARAVQMDALLLDTPGLGTAGAAGVTVGGILGLATTVNEAAETTGTSALPAAQQIVDAGTNLTVAKIKSAARKLDEAEVPDTDRFFFYTAAMMEKLLSDNQVTSGDFNPIQALQVGGFPMDHTWMKFKWRRYEPLPKTGNIVSAIALHKNAVGLAMGLYENPDVVQQPGKWNNPSIMMRLSGGGVRVDDNGVVQVNCDVSV